MVRKAFTLVEMLVVMGILAVLLALLMPAVGKARDQANGVVCSSHLRVLGAAFLAFATDHDNCLPGDRANWWMDQSTPDHFDWLFGQYSMMDQTDWGDPFKLIKRLATAPQYGTVWPYVNNVKRGIKTGETAPVGNYQVYLCPALTVQNPGSGVGSNGRFDYAAFSTFNGAKVSSIPTTCLLHWPTVPVVGGATGSQYGTYPPDPVYGSFGALGVDYPSVPNMGWSTRADVMPTPMICQEDARFNINGNMEGEHAGPDQMTHIHNGGSYYVAVDGSAPWVNEPDLYLSNFNYEGAHLWTAARHNGNVTPTPGVNNSGTMQTLDVAWWAWGQWTAQ